MRSCSWFLVPGSSFLVLRSWFFVFGNAARGSGDGALDAAWGLGDLEALELEAADDFADYAVDGEVRAIDDVGVLGDDEGGGAAGGIDFVAGLDGIGEALAGAALGADFDGGVDVEFKRGFREND